MPLLISDVADVEFTDDRIFVLTTDSKIMRFSSDGMFDGYIGKKGNGPGEYIYVKDICLASDGDRICLNDIMKGTFFYGLDGAYAGMYACETPGRMITSIQDGQYVIESVQVMLGNEADRLIVRDTSGSITGHFPNHMRFNYTPKATVTLIESGWVKHLFLIDKSDNTVYRSAVHFPGMEADFYPEWQSGDKLIDYSLLEE